MAGDDIRRRPRRRGRLSLTLQMYAWGMYLRFDGRVSPARRAALPRVAAVLALAAIAPLFFNAGGVVVHNMVLAAAYVVMALGLNIIVGFAGLLDLGYVAFFAIGAYTA